jgi:hypothetical protein
MSTEHDFNDELDAYEEQMGEIAQILLDDRLNSEEKIEEIEAIVFPGEENDE